MSVVDDVKARLDIVDVVSGYATLQKAGRNFKALCPFHQERTPSFVVFPETQTWRCFGACGEGGDVFGFVMRAEGWEFGETLRELANRAGVELKPLSEAAGAQRAETERLHALLDEAAHFYHKLLRESPAAQSTRDYVARRGLTDETAAAFELGYAPDDWRQALAHLQLLGYTQEEIVEAGVAIRNERGNVYDRFRQRLMIPIRDARGRTVGFGARALAKDAVPKYLNSPQGPLFDKSRLLYGLDRARRAIRDSETVVVVEGYMDVLQAHQAGFLNVVAQMGTALTETQLRTLDRYASRLILALDPDAAGINATMRGLNEASETLDGERAVTFDARGIMRYSDKLDIDIRVARLPVGKDPDDFIREQPDGWRQLIEASVPLPDYIIAEGTKDLSPQASDKERLALAQKLLPILLAADPKSTDQGLIHVQALARKIHIDPLVLARFAFRRSVSNAPPVPSQRAQRRIALERDRGTKLSYQRAGQSVVREQICLRLLIEQPERLYAANRKLRELRGAAALLDDVLAPLDASDFMRTDHQLIFRALEESLHQDADALEYLAERLSPELLQIVDQLREPLLAEFQRKLAPPLQEAEFSSVVRDQVRVNALPEPDTDLFVQESLSLRLSALEREWSELYFVQQDAQAANGDLTGADYQDTVRANTRARGLISIALRQMRNLARD